MPNGNKVTRYWERLARLSYPEYAHNRIGDGEQILDLSIWNDDLPPGVEEVALSALPRAVGAYRIAQDKALITLLARKLGVEQDNIIITAGADDALRIVSQYCIRSGTRALIPTPCFGRYAYHAMIQEAKIYYLPFDTYPYEFDIAKISEEVYKRKIECLYIASPNNPTGHALSRKSIKHLLDAVQCSVILDESLLIAGNAKSNMAYVSQYPNLFICGSFSKLYGLPGLRVGYLATSLDHIKRLKQLVSPFGVDAFGLEVAKHMVTQDAWLQKRVAAINEGITTLRNANNPLLRVSNTSAPVALVEYVGAEGNLHDLLSNQGVLTVPSQEFPGLDKANAVRVIIKGVKDMLQLTRALANIS